MYFCFGQKPTNVKYKYEISLEYDGKTNSYFADCLHTKTDTNTDDAVGFKFISFGTDK